MMNYVIIINPNSGEKKSTHIFKKYIIPNLKIQNHNFEHYTTEYGGHASKIIQNLNIHT